MFQTKPAPPVCGIRMRPWVLHMPRRWNRLMPVINGLRHNSPGSIPG
jgi:hypothetical protein